MSAAQRATQELSREVANKKSLLFLICSKGGRWASRHGESRVPRYGAEGRAGWLCCMAHSDRDLGCSFSFCALAFLLILKLCLEPERQIGGQLCADTVGRDLDQSNACELGCVLWSWSLQRRGKAKCLGVGIQL